jgi:hypothetical protein
MHVKELFVYRCFIFKFKESGNVFKRKSHLCMLTGKQSNEKYILSLRLGAVNASGYNFTRPRDEPWNSHFSLKQPTTDTEFDLPVLHHRNANFFQARYDKSNSVIKFPAISSTLKSGHEEGAIQNRSDVHSDKKRKIVSPISVRLR